MLNACKGFLSTGFVASTYWVSVDLVQVRFQTALL